MKKILMIAAFGLTTGLMSCHKCHECHYEMEDSEGNEEEVELGEYCDDELEDLEANGYTVDGTTYEVHCHEH